MRILSVTVAALVVTSSTASSTTKNDLSLAKNILSEETQTRRLEARRKLETIPVPENHPPHFLNQHRRFGTTALKETTIPLQEASSQQKNCDAAFLNCLPNDKCVMCFVSMQTEGIDWASVKPDTPCSDVVNFLLDKGHCPELKGDQNSIDTFCSTFDSCVVWDDKKKEKKDDAIDCDSLTSCNWDGMHETFLGDGICHDSVPGCYNHKICGYDAGDCCEDTCNKKDNAKKLNYVACGGEGYKCRDPASTNCDPKLSKDCEKKSEDKDKKKEPVIECGPDQSPFRIEMFDSFGDGWDQTVLTIAPNDDPNKVLFKEGLEEGSKGTKFVCLNSASTCYHVKVDGGTWGNEVSWEVHPLKQGSPSIAEGGAPMDCDFSVGGEVCLKTCEGKPENGDLDPDYKSYKSMFNCIDSKCVIQMGACKADKDCVPCLAEATPAFCYANENFNALVDCGLCHCLDEEAEEASDFCEKQIGTDDMMEFTDDDMAYDSQATPSCSAAETLKGSSAVMAFSKCADMDQLGMMITDFDESNFGTLDDFEKCSHEFQNENAHAGHKAMDCMTILHNAIDNPSTKKYNAPTEAISALAKHLYHDAESFCECGQRAIEDCPMCTGFMNFKTLLWESLDACQALDEIDCDAWNEFYEPCKANVVAEFGSVDFRDPKQCNYVQGDCGNAGLFPAFRKLDCGREIPSAAWDFYNSYKNNCVNGKDNSNSGGSPPVVPPPPPAPKPNPPPPSNPKPAPVHPSDNNSNSQTGGDSPSDKVTPKPYVPKESKSKPYKSKETKKKGHPFLRFLFFVSICAGGYYIWKKRSSAFEFVQYRRAGATPYPQDTEMYSSLSMEAGSSSFEPPTLPPTPMETMT